MILALAHAKVFAQYLSQCESKYIMQLALRELGISSARDGFHYALQAAIMLERNPGYSLAKEVYPTVGQMRDPAAGEAQVAAAITAAIAAAWEKRDPLLWHYYFPVGETGVTRCPTNWEFLMAIVDFTELWKGCCQEVNYAK